jgi:hypothetical protein
MACWNSAMAASLLPYGVTSYGLPSAEHCCTSLFGSNGPLIRCVAVLQVLALMKARSWASVLNLAT